MDFAALYLYAFGMLYSFSTGIAIQRSWKSSSGTETLTTVLALILLFGYWLALISLTGGRVV